MLQTKGELISSVKNQLRLVSIDSTITNRFIWSVIEKHLRWLLKRESDKMNLLGLDYLFQMYKCVEVIEAPAIDACCGLKGKCTIWRTKDPLPKMYEDADGVIIRSIMAIDGSDIFTPIKPSEYGRKLENPTTLRFDKSLYFFYRDGHLYFPGSRIRRVMIYGYFESEIINDCDKDCPTTLPCQNKLMEPARIPDQIKGELLDFVFKDLSQITLRLQEDEQVDKNETRKS
jgi:hypothetical protein